MTMRAARRRPRKSVSKITVVRRAVTVRARRQPALQATFTCVLAGTRTTRNWLITVVIGDRRVRC
jgi:hypothetical protein